MTVGDLQQYFEGLELLLKASGANKQVMEDLAAIQAGLAPFRPLSLKVFADFLVRAERFETTGELPVAPAKGGRKGKTGAGATVKQPPDVKGLTQEVCCLYEQASDPSVSVARIDATIGRLAPLKKADLVTVAEAIELKGMKTKKNEEIINAIRLRIVTRKGATEKTATVDRMPSREGTPQPALTASLSEQ